MAGIVPAPLRRAAAVAARRPSRCRLRQQRGTSTRLQVVVEQNAVMRKEIGEIQRQLEELHEVAQSLTRAQGPRGKEKQSMLVERLNKLDAEQYLQSNIDFLAQKPVYQLNLNEIVERCQEQLQDEGYKTHLFLHRELPIRTARAIVQLSALPHGYSTMPSTRKVRDWLREEFVELCEAPKPDTEGKEQQFTELLKRIHERFQMTIVTLGKGLWELKRDMIRYKAKVNDWDKAWSEVNDSLASEYPQLQEDLDRFYAGRLSAGFLVRQHMAIIAAKKRKRPRKTSEDFVGLVCRNTDIFKVCRDAICDATDICEQHYGDAPEVLLTRRPPDAVGGHFPHVPAHLNYILVELLKNSLRATVERHGARGEDGKLGGAVDCSMMPPIEVTVADSGLLGEIEDVSVRISDKGGGIPRSHMDRVLSYMYTTAKISQFDLMQDGDDLEIQSQSPLAGFGYGLPISRLYARHFGGDVRLLSMEGYGTDAYIHLGRTLQTTFEDDRLMQPAQTGLHRLVERVWRSPPRSSLGNRDSLDV